MTGSPAASRSWTERVRPARIASPRRRGGGWGRDEARFGAGRRAARGFSMLEVLVAFVILALVGTALFRLFSGALGNVAAADDYSRAVLVAESVLAETAGSSPLREGSMSGNADDGRIEWTTKVAPYTPPQANADVERATELAPTRLWRVTADVTFTGPDGKPRMLSLATVRIGGKETP